MHEILKGVIRFQQNIFQQKKDLFQKLSSEQHPETLFITCSDSRIDPSLLMQTNPGELFIHRNAGNFIPSYGSAMGGTTATIEYGVSVLQVKNIVVCGHTDCGALKALLNPDNLESLPAVKVWLQEAETTKRIITDHYSHLSGKELFVATIKENVLVQLDHLQTHPSVATRMRKGDLTLHGWVYSIATGEFWIFDPIQREFVDPDHFQGPNPSSQVDLPDSKANTSQRADL